MNVRLSFRQQVIHICGLHLAPPISVAIFGRSSGCVLAVDNPALFPGKIHRHKMSRSGAVLQISWNMKTFVLDLDRHDDC